MELTEQAAACFEAAGHRTVATVVFFARCPASYLTTFTLQMLEYFFFLRSWSKTPHDMHPDVSEPLDPRYWPAMRILESEFNRIEREKLEDLRAEGGKS